MIHLNMYICSSQQPGPLCMPVRVLLYLHQNISFCNFKSLRFKKPLNVISYNILYLYRRLIRIKTHLYVNYWYRRLWTKLGRAASLDRIGQVLVQLLIVFGFEEVFAHTPDMERYEVNTKYLSLTLLVKNINFFPKGICCYGSLELL